MASSVNEEIKEKFLPEEFKYVFQSSSHNSDTEEFTCKVRCNLKSEDMVKEWLSAFEFKTHTKWIVRDVNLCESLHSKYEYSKDYVCQLNSKNKTEHSMRNLKCKAFLKFRIKKDNKFVKCRDNFVRRGFLAILTISFVHSHRVKNAIAWKLLRPTYETLQEFKQYFRNGKKNLQFIK
jgi:hypothetical protein